MNNQRKITKILDYIDGKLKVNDYGYDDEAEHGYRECLKDLRAFIESLQEDKCEGCNNVKGCLNCVDGDQWAHYEVNKEKEMMKDAIEGVYDCNDSESWISFNGWACSTSRVGNNVKLIIIEEE